MRRNDPSKRQVDLLPLFGDFARRKFPGIVRELWFPIDESETSRRKNKLSLCIARRHCCPYICLPSRFADHFVGFRDFSFADEFQKLVEKWSGSCKLAPSPSLSSINNETFLGRSRNFCLDEVLSSVPWNVARADLVSALFPRASVFILRSSDFSECKKSCGKIDESFVLTWLWWLEGMILGTWLPFFHAKIEISGGRNYRTT